MTDERTNTTRGTRRRYLQLLGATAVGTGPAEQVVGARGATAETSVRSNESILEQDFENIPRGQYPDGWSTSGNSDQKVVDTHAASGSKSLRQRGSPGGCWQAIANAPLDLPRTGTVTISGAVRPTDQGSYGCHDSQHGFLGLRTTDGSWADGERIRFLVLKPDGTVHGRTGDSTELGTYEVNAWNDFTIVYTVRDGEVELSYTVNGTESGPFTVDKRTYEDQLDYLKLGSGDFVTLWDDFSVTRGSTNTGPNAEFTVSPSKPSPDETVTFDASLATDDGTIASYEWDLDGDGNYEERGQTLTRRFENEGDVSVVLRVTDDDGATATATNSISVSRDEFDRVAGNKLSMAASLDEKAIHLSERDDVEELIDQLRADREAGAFDDPTVPTEAVQRLKLGETTARRLVVRTNDRTLDSIPGGQQTDVTTEMSEFVVNLGVSLLLSKLSLTKALKNTRYGSLVPDTDWIASNIDDAFRDLLTQMLPGKMVDDAVERIWSTATEAYERIVEGQFEDSKEFTEFLSDSVTTTAANLSFQQVVETGGGVIPLGGMGPPPTSIFDEYVDVQSTLDRLNDRMRSEELQSQGLEGSLDQAADVVGTVTSFVDEMATVTDTFLSELQNKLEFLAIFPNFFEFIDGVLNDRLELWEAAGLLASILPHAGLAVSVVRGIGVYVGQYVIRVMMTACAVGAVDIEKGRTVSLGSVDNLVPDVDSILAEIEATAGNWGESA